MTYVLDASAVLRFLDHEAGWERVARILELHLAGSVVAILSAVHWGGLLGILFKRHGTDGRHPVFGRLQARAPLVVPVTKERAERSALIKAASRIPYVDAFVVELATDSPEHVLVAADFDFKAVENDVLIDSLPAKIRQ